MVSWCAPRYYQIHMPCHGLRHGIVSAEPNGLDKTSADRWLTVLGNDDGADAVRRVAAEIINDQKKSADKTCTIRLAGADARPQNEWSERDMIAMAFPVEFPFGMTSFRTPRHAPTEDLIDWTRHLAYLCYKLDDETERLEHTFQKNPAFVLYIRNRAHRHAINNDLKFYDIMSLMHALDVSLYIQTEYI